MTIRLIALMGLAGSGKSTAADHLISKGYRREKFADPLKDMLRAIGLSEREIEGDLKETPCDLLCGRTPREAMVALGTEWGRDLMHPDLWIKLWCRRALADGLVVTDDCRFPNEARAIRDLGGVIIRISRPGLAVGDHQSEALQADIKADRAIINNRTIADLYREVDLILETIHKP